MGIIFGLVPITIGSLVAPKKPNNSKNSIYECGFKEFNDARMKFDIRFYLVAILFIIFDLEIAYLFPWAVVLNKIGFMGFVAMIIFLVLLLLGFFIRMEKRSFRMGIEGILPKSVLTTSADKLINW